MKTDSDKTTYWQDHIFVGQQFILVDASADHRLEVSITRRGARDATTLVLTSPTVISRHQNGVALNLTVSDLVGEKKAAPTPHQPVAWPRQDVTTLQLATVITDRKIYKPRDVVHVFAIGLTSPGQTAVLEVRRASQLVVRNNLLLDDTGLAQTTLEDLDEGEYEATLSVAGSWTATCTFSVAAYSLSLLTAVLESHTYSAGILHFSATIRQLDAPFDGPVELGLQCQVCGGRVVQTKTARVRAGRLDDEFDVQSHGGPFHVQITTAAGDTATLSFPSTSADVREAITISPLGQEVKAGLLPAPGSQPLRGLHLAAGGASTTPFMAENVVASVGRIKVLSEAGPLELVTINPRTGETAVQGLAHVTAGEVLPIAVAAPYTLYCIGGWVAGKPYEAWGVLIHPEELQLHLDAPKRVLPGAEITVRVEANRPARCLLLVYDARLEHEDPLPKLAERLFNHVRDHTLLLAVGQVASFADVWARTVKVAPRPAFFAEAVWDDQLLRSRVGAKAAAMGRPRPAMGAPPASAQIEEMATETLTARQEFPEMVFIELFSLAGAAERTVKLGEQIGTWRCRAYAFYGQDYAEATADVQTAKDVYVELDLPAFLAPGDEVYARARYHSPKAGDLTIQSATSTAQQVVTGDGEIELKITQPGEVVARIYSGIGTDILSRTVAVPGRQKVTVSQLAILDAGQTLTGERVVVYPGMGMVLKDTIESLIQYPFG